MDDILLLLLLLLVFLTFFFCLCVLLSVVEGGTEIPPSLSIANELFVDVLKSNINRPSSD